MSLGLLFLCDLQRVQNPSHCTVLAIVEFYTIVCTIESWRSVGGEPAILTEI